MEMMENDRTWWKWWKMIEFCGYGSSGIIQEWDLRWFTPQKYIKIWRQDLWTDASIQIYFSLIFKEPGRDLAWCPPDELRAKRRTCPSPACEPWACLKVRNAVQSDAICISRIGTNSGEFQHILAITIFGTTSWEIPGQTWAAQPDHSLVALAAPGVRLPGEDRVSLKKIGSRGCSNLRFYRWSTNFEQAIPTQQLSISCWLCP